jgi:alkylation response protein AidB-like acyl-CoA dehydrogenase
MDFELSDDQRALAGAIGAVVKGRFPMEAIRAMEDGTGFEADRWRALADTGVFSLAVAEAGGGAGLGAAEAAVVFEVLGRHLVPGPLVATFLAATHLPGAADGSELVAHVEGAGPWVLEHPDQVAWIAVVGPDDVGLVARAEQTVTPIAHALDPLTPLGRWGEVAGAARSLGGAVEARRWRLWGATLTAAYQIGLAFGAVDLAVAYAGQREQFGRPIGSFQAVKHLCADMFIRAEVARAAVHAAACGLDGNGDGDVDRAVNGARLLAGEAAVANGKSCIQVHGGMGFTWEVDAQRYWKRATVVDTQFGSADELAAAVAATM